MCDFEDIPIFSRHTRQKTMDGESLVKTPLVWNDRQVLASTQAWNDLRVVGMSEIMEGFSEWNHELDPDLQKEARFLNTQY